MTQLENAVKRYNKIILDELFNAGINCWIAGGGKTCIINTKHAKRNTK